MPDVYLSPSLQEWNIGYGNYGSEEVRMNLIADVLEYELERHGLTTARNQPSMTLAEAVADSNGRNPRIHVSLHSNAANGQARGAEVYVHRFGSAAEELANLVYEQIENISPTDGLGVREGYSTFGGQGMYELRYTTAPAILAEVAFHDNPEDAQFIIDNIYELGNAIAKGILEYFDIAYQEDSPENIAYLQSRYNGILNV